MPDKKVDPGLPVITICIGPHRFEGAICDSDSSVNVMPKVIYTHVLKFEPLKPSKICLKFANQLVRRIKGIADNVCMRSTTRTFPRILWY